jgi:hypothetical protein
MERLRELETERAELEEHVEKCERLLRCWCRPRTFRDAEDLREETKTFLNIKS